MDRNVSLPVSSHYPIGTTFTVTNFESEKPLKVQGIFEVPLGETRTIVMTINGWALSCQ